MDSFTDLAKLVDLSKLSTHNTHLTVTWLDPCIVDYVGYLRAKEILASRIKGETFVDLGCGVGARFMQKAVEEAKGFYVGQDIQDLSSYFSGLFIRSDFYSFFDAVKKEQSLNYIVNAIDDFILTSTVSQEQFLEGILKTTKKYVLCLYDATIKKSLFESKEFDAFTYEQLLLGDTKPAVDVDETFLGTYLFVRK